jgi:hypothetical protein
MPECVRQLETNRAGLGLKTCRFSFFLLVSCLATACIPPDYEIEAFPIRTGKLGKVNDTDSDVKTGQDDRIFVCCPPKAIFGGFEFVDGDAITAINSKQVWFSQVRGFDGKPSFRDVLQDACRATRGVVTVQYLRGGKIFVILVSFRETKLFSFSPESQNFIKTIATAVGTVGFVLIGLLRLLRGKPPKNQPLENV